MIVSVAPLLKQQVGTKADFGVHEDPIAPRGDNADLAEVGFTRIDAHIVATHTDPGALLEGNASADVSEQCSRCLKEIRTPVEATFAEQYYATIGVKGEPLDEAPPDSKTIGSDFRIDLTDLLREELILATPLAPLCRPDCRGLCLDCGEDLNERPHTHDERIDERWTGLAALRDLRDAPDTGDDG